MKIRSIRCAGLRGATPEGGWSNELKPDDCVHTLVTVQTDDGLIGVGSVFTSDHLVRGALKLLVICVGHRMPDWVDAGVQEFARRMPRDSAMQIVEVKAEPRTQGKPVEVLIEAERARIEQAIPPRARIQRQ